ncbi:BCSC C-terminal domain-containing protein (plasmid) [Photobacterium sp. GJ3]|uniref:cellulose synthase subunit BcsC-related outer membrane protein n=1 Tax=Photobacterium sp. GJ3 TaxID=2829502 RepID=UPI001B8BB59D|nr:cellulose synthase subunit BcsC-related outer membrane protein [Photobacterium sp. GJ3]QUJ69652.1 BCSC C-terminal domain-containing protein [Photobacterium sp. GJ3]
MSVSRSAVSFTRVALSIGALFSSPTILAGVVPDTPLTPQQLKQVYQPVTPVQLATSLDQVDSVAFLRDQLALATALGRDDIVASALERLLAIDSRHPDGLYYQARLYLKQNQISLADAVVRQMNPDARQAIAIRDLMAVAGEQRGALQQARLLAHAGRYPEALQAYQALFPHGMPSPELQLEYLQVEGNIRDQWPDVQQGLEQLNAAYPGVPAFQLALANHIRRRNPADPWILETYRQLSLRTDLGRAAADAWLRALDQLPISQAVADQYAILASYYPSDLAINRANQDAQQRWETEQTLRQDPTYQAKRQGLALIEKSQYTQAERQLRYALTTRPKDPEILGGLGLVYLRMGQQGKALGYFQQAQALDSDPDNLSKWQSLIEASSYWAALDEGDALLAKGQSASAKKAYRKAASVNDAQPYAYLKMADVLLSEQAYDAADQAYLQALKREPGNASALRGRVNVREAQGALKEAIALIESMPVSSQRLLQDRRQDLKTRQALAGFAQAVAMNQPDEIERAADALLALNPTSAWQRRDIADALVSVGQRARADTLMREWSSGSSDPEMYFAYALYLSQSGREAEAVQTLSRVPVPQRTDAMSRNLARLKLNQSLDAVADRYAANPVAVRAQLDGLTQQYGDQPAVLARLGVTLVRLGERTRAEAIYRGMQPDEDWSESDTLGHGELMIALAKFGDFDAWLTKQGQLRLKGDPNALPVAELDELHAQRTLTEADLRLAQRQYSSALALYQQVLRKPEPYQTAAQLGVLEVASLTGETTLYQQTSEQLYTKKSQLTARQLMTAAGVMNQQRETSKANALNVELELRTDADAMDYRDAMAIAMANRHWTLAEQRGYQALNADRIDKSKDPAQASTESPDLRTLYEEADDDWLTRNVKADLDRLRDRSDGHVIIGWDFSARDGENQSSQVPIEARIPVEAWSGHLLLRADSVHVDSGDLTYFDKTPNVNAPVRFREQASGTALGVGWQAENWHADIGTTPLGFDHATWVGGVTLRGELGDFGVSGTLSRRPETSSTLSYAGMTVPENTNDPAGTSWGGVVRTGVKLNSSWDLGGPYGFWNSLQRHQMTGENVADNTRLALLGGAYYKLIATDAQRLSIGTNLLFFHYDKNLSEYTLGSGGYYSPDRYFSVSIPVNYYGRYDNSLSYLVSASVSNSWSQLDAPYQSDGADSTGGGFGYSLEAAVEKRVSRRWYLGASLDLQRSDFYEPNHVMLYFKYTFSDRWQPIEYPPAVPTLYSDFD